VNYYHVINDYSLNNETIQEESSTGVGLEVSAIIDPKIYQRMIKKILAFVIGIQKKLKIKSALGSLTIELWNITFFIFSSSTMILTLNEILYHENGGFIQCNILKITYNLLVSF